MKNINSKLLLLCFICAFFPLDLSAKPYRLLVVEKHGKVAFFLPTMHETNKIMRERLDQTLACLPEIGSIAIEVNSEDKDFSLPKFGRDANAQSKLVIPPDLLSKLDEISNVAMSQPRSFPDYASMLSKLGIHPSIILFLLDQPIRNYLALKNGWDLFGPSFETILTQYSEKKKIPLIFLESPQIAFGSFLKIPYASVVEQLNYLVDLSNDKVKQNNMLSAMDNWAIPLQYGDWTKSSLDSRSAALQAGYVNSYVDEIVVNRTKNMIEFFDALPKKSKPMLVAVGFAHFGGIDGIEKQLILSGYAIGKQDVECQKSNKPN